MSSSRIHQGCHACEYKMFWKVGCESELSSARRFAPDIPGSPAVIVSDDFTGRLLAAAMVPPRVSRGTRSLARSSGPSRSWLPV